MRYSRFDPQNEEEYAKCRQQGERGGMRRKYTTVCVCVCRLSELIFNRVRRCCLSESLTRLSINIIDYRKIIEEQVERNFEKYC